MKDNTFCLYSLLPSSKVFAIPYLLPIYDYTSICSFSVYAHLLLKTQFRVMTTVAQQPISSIPLKFLVWLVTYVINEIKETDTYSGDHTDISIINKDGYLNISKDTILKHYEDCIQMICKGLSIII